jgi:addiction module HigA family antidote
MIVSFKDKRTREFAEGRRIKAIRGNRAQIAEQLEELDMDAAVFAGRIGIPAGAVQAILDGIAGITGDMALRLGHFFGTSAEFWMNLQTLYELQLAEQRSGDSIRALPRLSDLKSAGFKAHP